MPSATGAAAAHRCPASNGDPAAMRRRPIAFAPSGNRTLQPPRSTHARATPRAAGSGAVVPSANGAALVDQAAISERGRRRFNRRRGAGCG